MSFRRPFFLIFGLIAILSSVLTLAQTTAKLFPTESTALGNAGGLPQDFHHEISWLTKHQHAKTSLNRRRQISAAAAATPVFANVVAYDSGGPGASFIAVADVNGDGKPDLLVANGRATGTNGVGVLLGNGDGTFQPVVTYSSFGMQARLAIGDINNDGAPDIVLSNVQGPTIVVLLGNGNGKFQNPSAFAAGNEILTAVTLADVNHDGKLDLIAANRCTNCAGAYNDAVGVLLGLGDGTSQNMVSYPLGSSVSGPNSVLVTDVNSDGKPDLVVSSNCATTPVCNPAGYGGAVSVLLGKGDGTFQTAAVYSSGDQNATSLAIADVNGDGKPDIVVSNQCVFNDYCYPPEDSIGVLLGKGDGTFRDAVTYQGGGAWSFSIAVRDVDGDGVPDALVAQCSLTSDVGTLCTDLSPLGELTGNGDGSFQPAVLYSSGGISPIR